MNIIAPVLLTMWAIGLIGLGAGFVHVVWRDDSQIAAVLLACVIMPLVIIFGVAPWALYAHANDDPSVVISLSRWQCSSSHQEDVRRLVGKAWQTRVETVCDVYTRK